MRSISRFWGFTGLRVAQYVGGVRLERARSEIALNATNLLDRKAQQHAFGDIMRRRVLVEYRLRF